MVLGPKGNVFIVWKKFQRRVEILAPYLDLDTKYFHYPWEEKTRFLKIFSYLPKSLDTLIYLFRKKPKVIFVQLPPTPALYCVALYSWMTGSRYVSDCHNSVIDPIWSNWIFYKYLLSRGIMVVHNDHIARVVKESMGLSPFVLRDGIIKVKSGTINQPLILKKFDLLQNSYVLLPWTFASDEPLLEVIEAAKMMPETKFVMTWYEEKLPNYLRKQIPPNIVLTGYLQIDDFNQLFSSAGIALVLTRWENTQLSGMQEAMAFEIPAVVSDLITTRFLYRDYPVFVKNEPDSIAEGVKYAFRNWAEIKENMEKLKIITEKEFSDQITILKAIIIEKKLD